MDPFKEAILSVIPILRAYAMSTTKNMDHADDLVQETILRAWSNKDKFEIGTNMAAWLFTILQNLYRSEYRKRRREIEDADGVYAAGLVFLPEQDGNVEMAEFREALLRLPQEQREALILVGASGFSYEEAAGILGIAIGTVKSRVNRAREAVAEILANGVSLRRPPPEPPPPPKEPQFAPRKKKERITKCIICGVTVNAKGLCSMHYWRLVNHGDPLAPVRKTHRSVHCEMAP